MISGRAGRKRRGQASSAWHCTSSWGNVYCIQWCCIVTLYSTHHSYRTKSTVPQHRKVLGHVHRRHWWDGRHSPSKSTCLSITHHPCIIPSNCLIFMAQSECKIMLYQSCINPRNHELVSTVLYSTRNSRKVVQVFRSLEVHKQRARPRSFWLWRRSKKKTRQMRIKGDKKEIKLCGWLSHRQSYRWILLLWPTNF